MQLALNVISSYLLGLTTPLTSSRIVICLFEFGSKWNKPNNTYKRLRKVYHPKNNKDSETSVNPEFNLLPQLVQYES